MPNEPQPQGACELQGRQIEAPSLPALVLPVDTHRWVLADNNLFNELLPRNKTRHVIALNQLLTVVARAPPSSSVSDGPAIAVSLFNRMA
jgi:hypothetical protein